MPCSTTIAIAETAFEPEAEIATFRAKLGEAGALVSFQGLVRGQSDGEAVTSLMLQHYPGMTEAGIAAFAAEAEERWPLEGILIIHRVGEMQVAEPIVLVATASSHRRAAFEAADFLMDYLKSRALFWKRETTATGSAWIEPRAADYFDAERWDTGNLSD